MATLINRECWTTDGCLRWGKVIEHRLEPTPAVKVRYDDGAERWCAATSIKLTLPEVLKECLDLADYWHGKAHDVMTEIDNSPSPSQWLCEGCNTPVQSMHVTYEETHDVRAGGCGGKCVAHIDGAKP
jgi:hypothetical protein